MLTKEILDSHPLKFLKSEIAKQNKLVNIPKYSNMKRPELTALMMKHKDKFHHIKAAEKKEKKAPKAKASKAKGKGVNISEKELLSIIDASEKAGKPQLTEKQLLKFIEASSHEMPDGTKMTGKVHSAKSKPIKEKKAKKPRTEKQLANQKKFGEAAKAKAAAKKAKK